MASPSRALSPSSLHARLSISSPRGRAPPMNRPSSPLSPRADALVRSPLESATRQPRSPTQLPVQSSTSMPMPLMQSTQQRRRQDSANLELPALPRFHPGRYPSAASSLSGTPRSDQNGSAGPVSPGLQQRIYSDVQRKLYMYQRDLHGWSPRNATQPGSVYLAPLGSPGLPMTPLTLDEAAEGYLDGPGLLVPPTSIPQQEPTGEKQSSQGQTEQRAGKENKPVSSQ